MRENFTLSLKWLLEDEGGYVNHPRDPGGATNKGVTQKVYNAYRACKGGATQSVKCLTENEIFDIYHSQYWRAVWADELPSGVDYVIFNIAVNAGASQAMKFLQRAAGVKADGVIGNITLAAVRKQDTKKLLASIASQQLAFYQKLKTWDVFGKGWAQRVANVQFKAISLVK